MVSINLSKYLLDNLKSRMIDFGYLLQRFPRVTKVGYDQQQKPRILVPTRWLTRSNVNVAETHELIYWNLCVGGLIQVEI